MTTGPKSNMSNNDEADGLDLVDHVVNQTLKFLDQFDQSNGASIQLTKGSIKKNWVIPENGWSRWALNKHQK